MSILRIIAAHCTLNLFAYHSICPVVHRTYSADINTSVLQVAITATTIQLVPHKPAEHIRFLTSEDWKYEASTAGTGGGGRTHTFGLKGAATKLRNAAVYQRRDVKIIGGKAVPANGD